jgi:hypothetical protein
LTDSERHFEVMAQKAKEAGAQWLAAAALFLMPSAAREFLPFIEEKFPRLAKRYREFYSRAAYAPEAYRREVSERIVRVRNKYGLSGRPQADFRSEGDTQLSFSLGKPLEI